MRVNSPVRVLVLLVCFATAVNQSGVALLGGGNAAYRQLTTNLLSLNFPSVSLGTSSQQAVIATNTGNSNVNIKQASIKGAGFSVNGPMLPLNLAPGQSTSFTVTFTPSTTATVSGSLSLMSNAINSPSTVLITGTGTAPSTPTGYGQLTPNPPTVNFGQITVGTSSTSPVIISNTGTASASISQGTITGSGFTMSGLPVPVSLAPGQSVSVSVTYTPPAAGTAAGQLAVSGTASNSPLTIPLSATAAVAVGQLAPYPTSLNFNNVTVGTTSSPQLVSISNTGTGSTTISQLSVTNAAYNVSGLTLPLTLSPGQNASFTVNFAPTTSGTATGTVSLVSDASNSPTAVSLTGNGVLAVGQLATNPTSVNFGNVTVGSTSSPQPVSISNTGTGSATISQANLTGSGFSISGLTLPLTLSPGQNTAFSVAFAPSSTGSSTGSIALVSNASNSPTNVTLAGAGANQHYVVLSWSDSSTSIAGYNIYRGSQSAGPYTRINSSLEPATTYTDSTVQAGQAYYYVTTAVNSSGAESGYSNAVLAAIPTP